MIPPYQNSLNCFLSSYCRQDIRNYSQQENDTAVLIEGSSHEIDGKPILAQPYEDGCRREDKALQTQDLALYGIEYKHLGTSLGSGICTWQAAKWPGSVYWGEGRTSRIQCVGVALFVIMCFCFRFYNLVMPPQSWLFKTSVSTDPSLLIPVGAPRSSQTVPTGVDLSRAATHPPAPFTADAPSPHPSSSAFVTTMISKHFLETSEEAARRPPLSRHCNIYSGKWVFDSTYPLWDPLTCPFVEHGFNCRRIGRPDTYHAKFRWQPHGCNLPRFEPLMFLERMRNRRLVFVGDSLSRNQFESMMCMCAAGANISNIFEVSGAQLTHFKENLRYMFQDFNFTIEYYRSQWLVNHTDRPENAPLQVADVLQLDSIDTVFENQVDSADVLVFNNGHWWTPYKTTELKTYFQVGKEVQMNMSVEEGYRVAMTTWAAWLDGLMARNKGMLAFLRDHSPLHFWGGDWNRGGRCDSRLPDSPDTIPETSQWEEDILGVNLHVLAMMKAPAKRINISGLSKARGDAHVGKLREVSGYDCSHWCLPGLPDTWNELLYAELLTSGRPPFADTTDSWPTDSQHETELRQSHQSGPENKSFNSYV